MLGDVILHSALAWRVSLCHQSGKYKKNVVTASVTELRRFSLPQDTLVKPESKVL